MVLGLQHPSTAQTLSNLALLFHVQCKYDQAEPLYQSLLEIRTKDWGPKHMHVAEVLNSLAEVYHDQGKNTEAEPLYWRAVEIIQESMGHEHPSVAKALRRLAQLYEEQENFSEADRLYRWGLGVSEKALGAEHPEVTELIERYAALQRKLISDDDDTTDILWREIRLGRTRGSILGGAGLRLRDYSRWLGNSSFAFLKKYARKSLKTETSKKKDPSPAFNLDPVTLLSMDLTEFLAISRIDLHSISCCCSRLPPLLMARPPLAFASPLLRPVCRLLLPGQLPSSMSWSLPLYKG